MMANRGYVLSNRQLGSKCSSACCKQDLLMHSRMIKSPEKNLPSNTCLNNIQALKYVKHLTPRCYKCVRLCEFLPILTRQSNAGSHKENYATFTKYRLSADTVDLPVTLTSLKRNRGSQIIRYWKTNLAEHSINDVNSRS